MGVKSIELKSIRKNDCQFLYDLLLKRKSIENISHKIIPSFKQHEKFVNSKPYKKWYVIIHDSKKIGSIYLSYQDEIGIQMIKDIAKSIQKQAIDILIKKNPRKRYLVNINPHNKKKILFFKKNNFKLIQYTYELELGD